MKKKIISLLLAVGMALSLAACGGGTGDTGTDSDTGNSTDAEASADVESNESEGGSADSKKLVIWTWDPSFTFPVLEEAERIYKEEVDEEFEIEIVEMTSPDCESKLQTCAEAGDLESLPDLVMMQDNSYQKFVTFYPEAFTDLTDSGIDFSKFAEGKLSYSTVDGKNYGVPFDNGAVISCYRTDILEEAGYTIEDITDVDWNQFIEVGKTVKEKTGKFMLSGVSGEPDTIMMMLQSAGASLFNEDGTPNLVGNEALEECIDIYRTMVKEGIFFEVNEWDEYVSSITNELCAGTINGNWISATIMGMEDTSGKWEITNMPKLVNTSGATNYSNNGGSSIYVSSNCKNTELAFDFLAKTFGEKVELYENVLPKTGMIGAYMPAMDSDAYQEPQEFWSGQPIFATILDYSEQVPTNNRSAYYYDVREAVSTALQDIIRGGDIGQVLEQAQADAEFFYN